MFIMIITRLCPRQYMLLCFKKVQPRLDRLTCVRSKFELLIPSVLIRKLGESIGIVSIADWRIGVESWRGALESLSEK